MSNIINGIAKDLKAIPKNLKAKTGNIDKKKLFLMNLPYMLAGYFCDKVACLWRVSPGQDASAKMMEVMAGLEGLFSNPLPSFYPSDLLIGVCCGIALRLAVYFKAKNAKKFRHGMEYGSARWGNEKDIEPYMDSVFENNILLTQTERLMMSGRPKQPKYARNKNILVIGGSGSGKTRFFAIFLGIGAGVAFYFSNIWINVVGMILLIWANSFDSADGQLARMTHQYSRLGRILDGLSGDMWFATIYVAICLRENVTSDFFSQHHWVIWVVAVVTGICHAKQAAMADYYRQFHLYFLKGEEGSELESSAMLRDKLAQLSWKHDFWKKLTLTVYTNYTVNQEAWTPAMQGLRAELSRRFPSGHVPQSFRDAFRAKSLPLMKYTNILSFNWRTIALFTSLFLTMPWLYFAFELTVLNLLLLRILSISSAYSLLDTLASSPRG